MVRKYRLDQNHILGVFAFTTMKGEPNTCVYCLLQEVWLDQEDVQLLKEGEEVTLMDWGNAIVQNITKSEDGHTITGNYQMAVASHVV